MLVMTLLSALTAVAPSPSPYACDLAPSVGQGQADEGKLDSITALAFGCRYELLNWNGLGISPGLGISRQTWSIYQSGGGAKDISSYQTVDYSVGLRLDYPVWGETKIFYAFDAARGTGDLNRTASSDQSTITGSYSSLKDTHLSHRLGALFPITERLGFSLAWERQDADQTWKSGSYNFQNVDAGNHLTLSSGGASLLGPTNNERTSSHYTSNQLELGLSLAFGGR